MTACLFPRLDPLAVEGCLDNLDHFIADAPLILREERFPSSTTFAAVGGGRVQLAVLSELRSLLTDIAVECGFPQKGSTEDRARFDKRATAALADFGPLSGGEADRDDVWAFISTVLVPDIASWRFSGKSPGRYHGGVRNTFQRLWMRAWALDGGMQAGNDRWLLLEALSEDALVALTERPSLGADKRLSRAIAKSWDLTAKEIGRGKMEEVMRRAVIDIRVRNEIQMLTCLDEADLDSFVLSIFMKAAGSDEGPTSGKAQFAEHRKAPAEPDLPSSPVPDKDRKTGELEIQHAILELMLDGNIWSNADLKTQLAITLPLTEADRGVGARPAEELWENRVNNALGRARGSSLYAKGFVQNRGLGLHQITEEGRKYTLLKQ